MSFFALFESNLNVPVNIVYLLTELWCSPSYVKQVSKEVWRGKECFIARGAGIEPVKLNTQDRTWYSRKKAFLSLMSSILGTHSADGRKDYSDILFQISNLRPL